MERVYNQKRIIDSNFNNELFLVGLKSELGDVIFKELINDEKFGVKITITMDVLETREEMFDNNP